MRCAGQVLVRREPTVTRIFALWVGVSAVVLAVELVLANADLVADVDPAAWPWRLKLLGAGNAALTLAVAAFVWWVRNLKATASAPVLRVRSHWSADGGGLSANAQRFRVVRLSNAGRGPAEFHTLRWRYAAADGAVETLTDIATLRSRLGELGLVDGVDYTVANYTDTAFAAGEERTYLIATEAAVDALSVFELVAVFDSVLGDRWERTLPLLPREGATRALAAPARS